MLKPGVVGGQKAPCQGWQEGRGWSRWGGLKERVLLWLRGAWCARHTVPPQGGCGGVRGTYFPPGT